MIRMVFIIITMCTIVLAVESVSAKDFYAGAGIGNTFFSNDFSVVEDESTNID